MKKTALIMAGGKGERFWPKGRRALPKQFLCLTGDEKTMIQLTIERVRQLVLPEDIFIISNKAYKELIKEQCPEIPDENIISEPEGRDTAACIGLGLMHIKDRYKNQDPVIFVLPADHFIKDNITFAETLNRAAEAAESTGGLITLGIRPAYPETGYGYIKFCKDEEKSGVYRVAAFKEKPDKDTAARYIESGDHLWNSGMFIWKASAIEKAFEAHLPKSFELLKKIGEAIGSAAQGEVLDTYFGQIEIISVDYGIMEKADNIFTIACDFGWDDVGSWNALERVYEQDDSANVISGKTIARDVRGSILVNESDRLVCVLGLEDVVVVAQQDVILVASKEKTGDIKKIVGDIEKAGYEELL